MATGRNGRWPRSNKRNAVLGIQAHSIQLLQFPLFGQSTRKPSVTSAIQTLEPLQPLFTRRSSKFHLPFSLRPPNYASNRVPRTVRIAPTATLRCFRSRGHFFTANISIRSGGDIFKPRLLCRRAVFYISYPPCLWSPASTYIFL